MQLCSWCTEDEGVSLDHSPTLAGVLSTLSSHVVGRSGESKQSSRGTGPGDLHTSWDASSQSKPGGGHGRGRGDLYSGQPNPGRDHLPTVFCSDMQDQGRMEPFLRILGSSSLLHAPVRPSDQAPPSTWPKPGQEKSKGGWIYLSGKIPTSGTCITIIWPKMSKQG